MAEGHTEGEARSIPLISTKENSHPVGWLFFFGKGRFGGEPPFEQKDFFCAGKSAALAAGRRSRTNPQCQGGAKPRSIPLISTWFDKGACNCSALSSQGGRLCRNGRPQAAAQSAARWDGGQRSGRPTQEGELNSNFFAEQF